MKFLKNYLTDETIADLNKRLGDELVGQIDSKLGDYTINAGEQKFIPKTVFDADKKALKDQLAERDNQLRELKNQVKDNTELTAKIAELETANKNSKEAYEKTLTETRQKYAFDTALSGCKAKNVKALEALIDKSKVSYTDDGKGGYQVSGLTEQVEALKKSDAYLFEGNAQTTPNPQNPPRPEGGENSNLASYFGIPCEEK